MRLILSLCSFILTCAVVFSEYKMEVTDRQAETMRKTYRKKSTKQVYDRDHANIRNAYEIRAARTMLLCFDTDHTRAIYH